MNCLRNVACVVGWFALTAVAMDDRGHDSELYFVSYMVKNKRSRLEQQSVVVKGNEIKLKSSKYTALLTYDENMVRLLYTDANDSMYCYMMHLDFDDMPGFYELKTILDSARKTRNNRLAIKKPTDIRKVAIGNRKRIPLPSRMSPLAVDMCKGRHFMFSERAETPVVANSRWKLTIGIWIIKITIEFER